MIELKRIGGYFENDTEGFVINPASADKISEPWDKLVQAIRQSYIEHLGDRIHSVYIRGSVPQGLAVQGVSDINTFALVHLGDEGYIQWNEAAWSAQVQEKVQELAGFPVRTELMLTTFTEDFIARNPGLSMVIKTQSACIYGADLSPMIKKYKPGTEMMMDCWHLKTDLQKFTQLPADTSNDLVSREWQSLMKCLVRSGFELVMEREGKYTNSLYTCYEAFSKHYPEKKDYMYIALNTCLNPITDKRLLIRFIDDFGVWMVIELLKMFAAKEEASRN